MKNARLGAYPRRFLTSVLIAAAVLAGSATAATITVNLATDEDANNADCSLREAIYAANNDVPYNGCVTGSGADTIAFAIPGAGPHIIGLNAALPDISAEIHIDGYTQSGAAANALASGTDADIRVGIANGGAVNYGLTLVAGADGSSIRGLRITGFSNSGILLFGDGGLSGITIAGNFIGTDGTNDLGNSNHGVFVMATTVPGVTNSLIGGPLPADRNLIAGNNQNGILIGNSGTSGITIQNNLIGTTADGNSPLSQNSGIWLSGSGSHTVTGNVIGGNNGVYLSGVSDDNLLTANSIGVGADGVSDIGGTGNGVVLFATFSGGGGPQDNMIGGTGANDGNVIANWGQDGVHINRNDILLASFSRYNQILGNRIYGNGGLGIELTDDQASGFGGGVSLNDLDDADVGPNGYQNFPVITSAVTDGANTAVSFTLDGEPSNMQYRVEFFSNASCDASGHGEGEVFLDGRDWITFDGDLAATSTGLPATTPGHFITMTATKYDIGTNETSEFSACVPVTFGALNGEPPVATPVMSLPALAATALLLGLGGGLARRRRS